MIKDGSLWDLKFEKYGFLPSSCISQFIIVKKIYKAQGYKQMKVLYFQFAMFVYLGFVYCLSDYKLTFFTYQPSLSLTRFMVCSLQWCHNGHDNVSNHQPHNCVLNRLFRRRSKKTAKLRVTGLCAGNSLGNGEFLTQMASNAENVSIWWRHHVMTWQPITVNCWRHCKWITWYNSYDVWTWKAISNLLDIVNSWPHSWLVM